jgi:phosphopantothenate synthetase
MARGAAVSFFDNLPPRERELLEAATELREAREHLEKVRDRYRRGECVRLFVQRALDRLQRARQRCRKLER